MQLGETATLNCNSQLQLSDCNSALSSAPVKVRVSTPVHHNRSTPSDCGRGWGSYGVLFQLVKVCLCPVDTLSIQLATTNRHLRSLNCTCCSRRFLVSNKFRRVGPPPLAKEFCSSVTSEYAQQDKGYRCKPSFGVGGPHLVGRLHDSNCVRLE
jgi:hypothetical protein